MEGLVSAKILKEIVERFVEKPGMKCLIKNNIKIIKLPTLATFIFLFIIF
jgi:hypothetical protein